MNSHFREQDSFIQLLEITPLTRQRIESVIETLVILLDDFDGDPDLEANGDDEPLADDEPDYDDEPEEHWTTENRFDWQPPRNSDSH